MELRRDAVLALSLCAERTGHHRAAVEAGACNGIMGCFVAAAVIGAFSTEI